MKSEVKDLIKNLSRQFHSFYVYDLDQVRTQLDSLNLPKNVKVYYAMKANDDYRILDTVLHHPRIEGIEIASRGEAEKVLNHKDSLAEVVYTGPGKRPDELEFVLDKGIRFLNIESLTEAYRIQNLAKRVQPVLLRLNTNKEIHGAATRMSTIDEPTPFGFPEDEALEVIKKIKSLNRLFLQGLHIFGASGVLEAKDLLDYTDYSLGLARKIEKDSHNNFPTLDFGGGLGVDYESKRKFDILFFSKGLELLIKKHKMQDKTLLFELGRYIVADSGYFCTKINDIKLSHGKKILVCTAGTNAHRRPYAMKINYPTEILNLGEKYLYDGQLSAKNESVQVRGPLCTMADVLSYNTYIKKAEIGDFVVQRKAGAYGADMSHKDFLSHDEVPEFVIGEKR